MPTRKRKSFSQNLEESQNSVPQKKSRSDDDCLKRAGTISRMTLRNFMCHSLLEVNFSNNITFVVGKNGSGKSAILTALIVGLGGKASLTNRGTSVKGLVKAGKPSASIEIELFNEGPMAYRPNVYGNCIVILRNLNSSGGGSYRIKSQRGEIISTQAREINNITISLNIQVDNPICILNQDTSRNFLSGNNPKNMFTLFMKATKLECLELEYKKTKSNKNDSDRVLTEKANSFRKLQEEIKDLKVKIDNHKSIIPLKDRKVLLQTELVWARARDVEEQLETNQKQLDGLEKKLNDFKINSENRVQNLTAFKKQVESLEQQVLETKDQIEVQKNPQRDLHGQVEELNRNMLTKKREKQQIMTSIENKNGDIESLKQDILTSKENMTNVEQQKMERIKSLASLEKKLKNLDDHLETSKNDLFQIRGNLAHKEHEERNLIQEISQIDQNINNEKRNLKALNAGTGDDLLVYGRDVPKIKQMISQYSKMFQHEPKGPLGSYIKVKDKKWSLAVEGYIGPALLRAFAVDNKKDNQLLRTIFNKVLGSGSHPQIITSKFVFKKHDVSRNLVQEPNDCVSIYNAIDIDDPVASNFIVDNCGPENILLIPSDARAQELLSDQRQVPRNCAQGVTIKGDKYYPDPNYRSYASSYHRAQYLQVDTKEHIKQLQQNVENLQKKKQAVTNQLEAFRNDMKEQIDKRQQLEEKLKKINLARKSNRTQLQELHSTAEPEVQNVQFLEQELEECRRILNEKTADLERTNEEIKEIKAIIREKQQGFSQLQDSTKDLEERIQNLTTEIRENQTKQKEMSTSDDFDKRRIREYESRVNEVKSEMAIKQKELEQCIVKANEVGDRLPELRQVIAVTNEINEIKNKISKIETTTENVTDLIERYNTLSEKFKQTADIMKQLSNNVIELTTALDKRSRHYKLTENYFVTYMKYSFQKILEYRQFQGNIDIDLTTKKLELVVIPQHGSQGHTTTSNLSGGERSFSTVAFLYSLWQCMELPFYFLDEFDVYMDKLNRTKVIDILLHHAKSKPQLQFVFLTPQDVSFVGEDVSILRLEDPERLYA